jgi:hypothetical protein
MRTRTTAFVALLAAAVGMACPGNTLLAAEDPKECKLTMYDSIDLIVASDGDIFVPASFNGHAGVMSLTLSSAISFIHQSSVEQMGLDTRRSPVLAYINNVKATQLAKFKQFAIGNAGLGKGEFLVNSAPVTRTEVDGKPVLGALGTEAFTVLDFELDLSRKKLNLFSQKHCRGSVVYWADDWGSAPLYLSKIGTMFFPVELENKKVEATFAPGAAYTRLTTDVTQRLYGFDENSPGIEKEPAKDGDEPNAHFRAMQMTARGMTVRNSRIQLVEPATQRASGKLTGCKLETSGRTGGGAGYSGCENTYPMHLGRNVLNQMRFYFATKEKMIYFTLANATKAGAPASTPD